MSVYPKNHTSFFKLYASDIGVASPYDATLGVSLPAVTSIPTGAVDVKGYSGLDAIFYFPADTADRKFKYEVLFYYKVKKAPTGQSDDDALYVPLQFATAAVDNLIGAETGLANGIVGASDLFADTLLSSMALAYHGTGLQTAHLGTTPGGAVPELVAVSTSAANGIAMLHIRKITADWVRIHPYKGNATSYAAANVLVRLVNE